MRRSQISLEFIVLFAFVLVVFMLFMSVVPDWLEKSRSVGKTAERMSGEVKILAITASLSESDFESTYVLPAKIDDKSVAFEFQGDTDLLLIKDTSITGDAHTGAALARQFLPVIDNLNGADTGNTLNIKKTNGVISITLT
jgi:hypothetical protein